MVIKNDLSFSLDEVHPWLWHAPEGCKVLIIGTFPTATKNRAFDFYYPNLRNLFWRVMENLSQIKIENHTGDLAVQQRKGILEKLKIAVTDMGYKIKRTNGSSLDSKISATEYMDIFKILDENKGIHKIILTSSSGKSSAYGWFKHYLQLRNHTAHFESGKLPFYGKLEYKGREINITVLPSTSPAAAIGFNKLLDIYQKEILN